MVFYEGALRMPYVQSDDARLYYETAGSGTPIVFVHEFSGDLWSWEKQIQHFSRRYHCVAFNARGYPPSDVPTSPKHYSHHQAVDDVAAVMPAQTEKGAYCRLFHGLAYNPRFRPTLSANGDVCNLDRHWQRR